MGEESEGDDLEWTVNIVRNSRVAGNEMINHWLEMIETIRSYGPMEKYSILNKFHYSQIFKVFILGMSRDKPTTNEWLHDLDKLIMINKTIKTA